MRIDHVGVQSPITVLGQTGLPTGRTEAPVKAIQTKKQLKQEQADAKNQEKYPVEGDFGAKKKTEEKDVIKGIEKANKHFRTYDRRLEFAIHDVTKEIMVKVINTENDTVIREIPSEKVLDMVAHLWEISGILVDEHR